MNNPWNSDTPWNVPNIWTVSKPIIESMAAKCTGHPSKSWHQHVCDMYLAPALSGSSTPGSKQPKDYRCLILGSTELVIEQHLWNAGFSGEIVSSDIADKALARSRIEAEKLGISNVKFVIADLNSCRFEGKFDFIIANGILHHIIEQESCLDMLCSVLLPDGLLIAAEFTGPFRFQLPPIQVEWINAMLAMMPGGMRNPPVDAPAMEPLSPEAHWKRPFVPVAEEVLTAIDPTEAISGHTLDANLRARFAPVQRSECGGTLTTYLHDWLDYRTTNDGPFRQWMQSFIHVEERLIANGILNSDYTFYVMRKYN